MEGVILNIDYPSINDEAEFYHFSFDSQTEPATIGENIINIDVEYGTDLTSLIPTFQMSRGATAKIDDNIIISGETIIDFSAPVNISVTAENETYTKTWVVYVTEIPVNTETAIISENIKLFPNPCNNIINIYSENISTIEIFNSSGKLIHRIDNVNNQTSINLKNKSSASSLLLFKFTDKNRKIFYRKVILE